MLKADDTGLMVVDIQGRLARMMQDSDAMISNIVTLIESAKLLNLPILWMEQIPEKLGETVPEIQSVLTQHQPISKFTFDGCGEPAVVKAIEDSGINQWLLCGIETHICVYQTALSLLGMGRKVEIVADCVSSRSAYNKQLALQKMASLGAGISCLEMCLFELMVDSRNPVFRDIQKLLK